MTETPHVTTIILAAGSSSRFDEQNKLLEVLNGVTVIEMTLQRATASPTNEVIVVTGFRKNEIERLVDDMGIEGVNIRSVFNPDFEKGMASSIVCGVRAVAPDHDFLIWPGDMPLIATETATRVIRRGGPDSIAVPIFERRRGHPVFFGRSFRDELLLLNGDRGARSILGRHPESIIEIEISDPGIVIDVDTRDDLLAVAKLLNRRT